MVCIVNSFLHLKHGPPRAVIFSWWGWIEYLSDPDSYAGWSFYTPGRATQARQVEGYRSDKVAAQSNLSFHVPIFHPLLSYYSALLFLLFPCFTRPYITFLRCSDVKPISLTH